MKNQEKKRFGKTRAFVTIVLLFLGIGYLTEWPALGILLILAVIYLLTMDRINDRIISRKPTEVPVEHEYDPDDYGEPVACPYCGKEIPSEINYCFYCGKDLDAFKHIEAVRTGSLAQINDALTGLKKSPEKGKIVEIRDLADKILKQYEKDPEEHEDFEKFTDSYLPKTVAAIKHYSVLCNLDNLDSDEEKIRAQLEDSFDLMTEAYSKIYNRASTEGLDDVSVDVSVLENIMKMEGLTEDFH